MHSRDFVAGSVRVNDRQEQKRLDGTSPPSFDVEVDWHLTNRCNFFCDYCHPQIRRVLNQLHLNEPSPEVCIEAFDAIGKPCHILMSGGEPFMFPEFIRLCRGLTNKHLISINTNLSHGDIPEFADEIDPSRVVRIAAALHIAERESRNLHLDEFIAYYRCLRERGFPIIALYVLYPPLLERVADDLHYLRSNGVDMIDGKVFKGVFESKRYPDAYTPEQRAFIHKVTGEYKYNKPYLDGLMSFTGQQCNAGFRSFKVMVDGEVRRCATVQTQYGNLYKRTMRLDGDAVACPARRILVVSQCLTNLVNNPTAG